MSQKKENKPCNGQFSKDGAKKNMARKQNWGFGEALEKGGDHTVI